MGRVSLASSGGRSKVSPTPFWHRWRMEYLLTLQRCRERQKEEHNLYEGDIVILKDKVKRRNKERKKHMAHGHHSQNVSQHRQSKEGGDQDTKRRLLQDLGHCILSAI